MNLEELVGLTAWIDQEIRAKNVVQHYQQLHSVLAQNAQPQAKQPFEAQKTALEATLNSIDIARLNLDQVAFLEKLNIGPYIGQRGVDCVEDILVKNPVDIATAVAQFAQIITLINQALGKVDQIKGGLSGCVDLPVSGAGEILIRVNFSGHAAMNNVVDFKRWGADWHDIGRGIAMAHDAAPEDIRIVGAKKGSVILELAVAYGIAQTVSAIILEALKVAERVIDIRRKAEEVRTLRLMNDGIEKQLAEAAEEEEKQGVERITLALIAQLGKDEKQHGDQVKALQVAIKKMVGFIEDGGGLDCVVPDEQTAPEGDEAGQQRLAQMMELRSAFSNIRQLESKIKQLEHKE